jgi:Kef-type K+ transport system membrane component KefB
MQGIFSDIGMIIIVAAILGIVFKMLRQPIIPAFIIAGILLGPVYGLVTDISTIRNISEIGIAFLLFMVGLELDMRKLKNVLWVSIIGGLLKSLLLFIVGWGAALILGFSNMASVYIGMIVTFSSTMVVVKLLSDKKELETLHGRIIVGTLLVEDLLVIIALAVLTTVNNFTSMILLQSLLKIAVLLAATWILAKFIFPGMFKFAAKSAEILFISSVAVCFGFCFLAKFLGFSIAIGAFLGGIGLATLPYNIEIVGKIKSLRDFFAIMFFVSLGMELTNVQISALILPIVVILALVLIFKPILSIAITSLFGFKKRTSFLTAISLAQTSEFSLIIVSVGYYELMQVSKEIFSMTILLAVITIGITPYLVKFDDSIYRKIGAKMKIFERFSSGGRELEYELHTDKKQVILVGYDRMGYHILQKLHLMKKNVFVVDFNPDIIKRQIHDKVPCMYGDIGDSEVLDKLGLETVEMVISTSPDATNSFLLVKKVKEVNKKAVVFVTAYHVEDALHLYDEGADYVILPHFLGGEHASIILEEVGTDVDKLLETKLKHIKELHERRHLGHEHPHYHKMHQRHHQ